LREGRVPEEHRGDRVMCDRKTERSLDQAARSETPSWITDINGDLVAEVYQALHAGWRRRGPKTERSLIGGRLVASPLIGGGGT
jgi:hypothetical protein